jgi:hypothetical protein
MKLSVIICTHNPRPQYLSGTLEALRRRTLAKAEWELLVIDNVSRSSVAASVSLSWHANEGRMLAEDLSGAAVFKLGKRRRDNGGSGLWRFCLGHR